MSPHQSGPGSDRQRRSDMPRRYRPLPSRPPVPRDRCRRRAAVPMSRKSRRNDRARCLAARPTRLPRSWWRCRQSPCSRPWRDRPRGWDVVRVGPGRPASVGEAPDSLAECRPDRSIFSGGDRVSASIKRVMHLPAARGERPQAALFRDPQGAVVRDGGIARPSIPGGLRCVGARLPEFEEIRPDQPNGIRVDSDMLPSHLSVSIGRR